MSVVLTSGCSPGDGTPKARAERPQPVVVDGHTIDASEAVDGLCEARRHAPTDAGAAKSTYVRRSHDAIDAIIQVLQPSNAPLAGSMRRTVERVQGTSATERETSGLADDLDRLASLTREGLARLGVTTAPCPM